MPPFQPYRAEQRSPWRIFVTKQTGHVAEIDIPLSGKQIVIGRDRHAVASNCRIDHKYVSHVHLSVEVRSRLDCTHNGLDEVQVVCVTQKGKNPTLLGPNSVQLKVSAHCEIGASEGSNAFNSYKHAHIVGPTTFHFPDNLGLPMLHVVHVSPKLSIETSNGVRDAEGTGATTTSIQEVVVRLGTLTNDDDDEDDAPPPPSARSLRLLDEAMREQAATNARDAQRDADMASWVPPAPQVSSSVVTPSRQQTLIVGGDAHSPPSLQQASSMSTLMPKLPPLPEKPKETIPAPQPSVSLPVKMGFWEWKSHPEGDDSDPKNWKRYVKTVADKLEASYRHDGGRVGFVSIDDTYNVAFDDIHLGMVQFRKDDPTRWRAVRRRGGDPVSRQHAKKKVYARDTGFSSSSSSSSARSDDDDSSRPSWIVSDSDDDASLSDTDEDDVSFDTESSLSTNSSTSKKKHKKTKNQKKAKNPSKRDREE